MTNNTKKNILVTGGAGFIGSNLVESLLKDPRVGMVRVLDNLSNGFEKNIKNYLTNPNFEFLKGDIRSLETCLNACKDIDLISHQAALGSVPRSIKDPITSNEVNISGTLNIFQAAVESKIPRVVFASSSSSYGDSEALPKVESVIGRPLSPYAVTKFVNELYADVFSQTYNFKYIGLRYFNIFGPKQDPNGAYAAVIPLFFKAALDNKAQVINGDGSYSRDFTFVQNAVQANIKALFTINEEALNQIYNIACGQSTTLNELRNKVNLISGSKVKVKHGPFRKGDVPHSLADITKAKTLLDYNPIVDVSTGLEIAFDWYQNTIKSSPMSS